MSFSSNLNINGSNLPSWQKDLIAQIIFALNSYYANPAHLNETKKALISSLVEGFEKINLELKSTGKSIDLVPFTGEEYQLFLNEINPLLENFDSHMHLQYHPQFIAEVKQNNQVVMQDNLSPRFDLGNQMPDERLLELNQIQADPRNNYGFVTDPDICSLHVIDDVAIGKEFYQTPTYVLAKDGLYFIERHNQKISENHLIVSNKDSEKYMKLCDQLPQMRNQYGIILPLDGQEIITKISGHIFPKKNVPENVGYLKVNYLLEPKDGEHKSNVGYQLGPNAIKVLDGIMKSFENKDAIILDLRNAPQGGSPAMTHYLISFFIAQKGLLIDEIYDRRRSQAENFYVRKTPVELFTKPVTILVDESTFSAREALAFHMQKLNKQLQEEFKQEGDRFQVIGTQTKGGAHPTYSFPLASPSGAMNKDVILWLPCSASTKKDWEGIGITPDIKIKPDQDALKVAITQLFDHSKSGNKHEVNFSANKTL